MRGTLNKLLLSLFRVSYFLIILCFVKGCMITDPFTGLLVSGDELATQLDTSGVVIIDARSAGYESGHIPGAISLKWGDYVNDAKNLKPLSDLEVQLGAAGLSKDMVFVIYDDTTASWGAAGRVFWMLEYLGCTNAHILNGGWDKWVADGRATETAVNTLPPSIFIAEVKEDILVDKNYIQSRMSDDDFIIIDSRTDEEFNGWVLYGETRGGHIPGVVQIPYAWFFKEDKTILDYQDLKNMLESRGITTDKEITSYCTAGIRSGFVYFILRLLGYTKCSNYDGSMYEWSTDSLLPMEKLENYEKLVYPAWVKQLIEYHEPGSTTDAPPEYPYDRNHKYLIFETQWGTIEEAEAYNNGHIPGAIHSNSDTYENGYPRWFLIPDEDLHAAMGSMGITSDTTVVVYSNSPIFAARLWWILMYGGVEDVRYLNGGYEQWIASGYSGETTINEPVPTTFNGSVKPDYSASTDQVFNEYADTDTVFLADVRSYDEYTGEISGYSYLAAKGRIPNAVWAYDADDASSVYHDADSTLRSYTEIRDLWGDIGMTSTQSHLFDKDIIFYCGGGYRSALTFLYAYLMGFENIRNYSDGWAGWSTTYTYDPLSCTESITPDWCQEPSGRPFVTGP